MQRTFKNLPMKEPAPDMERCLKSIMEGKELNRPPLVEYIVDVTVMKPIVKDLLGRSWVEGGEGFWDNFIQFWYRLGYDHVRLEMGLPFPMPSRMGKDPASGGDRGWAETGKGPIQSWNDFEVYPWPKLEEASFEIYEYVARNLPEGMGLFSCHGGGILEHVTRLFGYETLCVLLHEAPDLVQAVVDRVGELLMGYHASLMQIEAVQAIFQGDDMGFKTSTLISPHHLRQYFFPWHARFADQAHNAGRAYFLHACGNLEEVMEDLITTVKIDAKHSFEDAVVPVIEMKRRYGDRIGILGGVDVDVLTRKSPEEIRSYVRSIVEACMPGGRFALGSGNSIPSYVPVDHFLTMVDEALNGGG